MPRPFGRRPHLFFTNSFFYADDIKEWMTINLRGRRGFPGRWPLRFGMILYILW